MDHAGLLLQLVLLRLITVLHEETFNPSLNNSLSIVLQITEMEVAMGDGTSGLGIISWMDVFKRPILTTHTPPRRVHVQLMHLPGLLHLALLRIFV